MLSENQDPHPESQPVSQGAVSQYEASWIFESSCFAAPVWPSLWSAFNVANWMSVLAGLLSLLCIALAKMPSAWTLTPCVRINAVKRVKIVDFMALYRSKGFVQPSKLPSLPAS